MSLRESSIVESNCILSFWDTNWPFIKKMIRRLISGFKAWGEWALIWISFLNLLLHNSSIHKTFDLQVYNYSLACIRGQMALIVCEPFFFKVIWFFVAYTVFCPWIIWLQPLFVCNKSSKWPMDYTGTSVNKLVLHGYQNAITSTRKSLSKQWWWKKNKN